MNLDAAGNYMFAWTTPFPIGDEVDAVTSEERIESLLTQVRTCHDGVRVVVMFELHIYSLHSLRHISTHSHEANMYTQQVHDTGMSKQENNSQLWMLQWSLCPQIKAMRT